MNNFITIYSLVLKDFSFDNNKYEINVNYNEEKSIFDVSIFNITHNINSFYKINQPCNKIICSIAIYQELVFSNNIINFNNF